MPWLWSRQGISRNGIDNIRQATCRVAALWIWSSFVEQNPRLMKCEYIFIIFKTIQHVKGYDLLNQNVICKIAAILFGPEYWKVLSKNCKPSTLDYSSFFTMVGSKKKIWTMIVISETRKLADNLRHGYLGEGAQTKRKKDLLNQTER